jgi:hypothetical protein
MWFELQKLSVCHPRNKIHLKLEPRKSLHFSDDVTFGSGWTWNQVSHGEQMRRDLIEKTVQTELEYLEKCQRYPRATHGHEIHYWESRNTNQPILLLIKISIVVGLGTK